MSDGSGVTSFGLLAARIARLRLWSRAKHPGAFAVRINPVSLAEDVGFVGTFNLKPGERRIRIAVDHLADVFRAVSSADEVEREHIGTQAKTFAGVARETGA